MQAIYTVEVTDPGRHRFVISATSAWELGRLVEMHLIWQLKVFLDFGAMTTVPFTRDQKIAMDELLSTLERTVYNVRAAPTSITTLQTILRDQCGWHNYVIDGNIP